MGCCSNLGRQRVGILGKHATLNCNPEFSADEAPQIAEALLHLSRTISTCHAKEYLFNQRGIISITFKLRGKSNWDSTLPTNACATKDNEAWKVPNFKQHPLQEAAFFVCPSCVHVESSHRAPFQNTDLDIKIACNDCQKTSRSQCGSVYVIDSGTGAACIGSAPSNRISPALG